MNRRLFVFAMVMLSVTSLVAKDRTEKEMKALAVGMLQTASMSRGTGRTAGDVSEISSTDTYVIYGNADDGFVVVSRDDAFPAILAYSSSEYPVNRVPDGLKWWTDMADMVMKANIPFQIEAKKKKAVEPLVESKWDQFAPFYLQTPTYDEGGEKKHYPTGCLATAMAQVINYHQYPAKGTGGSAYFVTGKTLPVIVDFSQTNYEYNNMLADYLGDYSEAQGNAVATLMYHCGAAVEMTYDKTGSGAYPYKGCKALRKYFCYGKSMLYSRDYIPSEMWDSVLYGELQKGHPVIFGATDPKNGGHAFVIDGNDEDGLLHVNWGWSGDGNGYYDMALLNPAKYSFTKNQNFISVRKTDDEEVAIRPMWSLLYDFVVKQADNGKKLSVACNGFYNLDAKDFTGKIGIIADDGSQKTVLDSDDITKPMTYGYGTGYDEFTIDVSSLADGTYNIYIACMPDNSSEWYQMLAPDDITGVYILTINGSEMTLKADHGGTTGIVTAARHSESVHDTQIYDLQGRRVDTPRKGIYIRNGRKIVH